MTRRKQKFNSAKARTLWLAWSAWGVIGAIFVFEDLKGGSGWLTILLTLPLWGAFVVWPFLYGWLRTRRDATYVEIDDDIVSEDKVCRMVQKNNVRYGVKDDIEHVFGLQINVETVKLEGGDESFVPLDAIRNRAKECPAFKSWLVVVDSLAYPKTYF